MPCDLTDMEIQILYILYRNKNFKIDAGYHSEKLKKILRKKYDQDFDEAIVLLATAKLQGEESKRDVTTFFTMFQDEIKVLRRKNVDKLDWLPRLQSPARTGSPRFHSQAKFSQAGSKFGPYVS